MTKVGLVVGHGSKGEIHDPGAMWQGTTEYDLNRKTCAAATESLRRSGINVVSESDLPWGADPNFSGSDDIMNAAGVDLAVSFHHDCGVCSDKYYGFYVSPMGQELAAQIRMGAAFLGLNHSTPRRRDNLGFLNSTAMPATLLECGRTGPTDTDDLEERGEAAAIGIIGYLNKHHGTNFKWVPESTVEMPVDDGPTPQEILGKIKKTNYAGIDPGGWYSWALVPGKGKGKEGLWLAFPNGDVHTLDSQFHGTWHDDDLQQHLVGREFAGILAAPEEPNYEYWLVSDDGSTYGRPA